MFSRHLLREKQKELLNQKEMFATEKKQELLESVKEDIQRNIKESLNKLERCVDLNYNKLLNYIKNNQDEIRKLFDETKQKLDEINRTTKENLVIARTDLEIDEEDLAVDKETLEIVKEHLVIGREIHRMAIETLESINEARENNREIEPVRFNVREPVKSYTRIGNKLQELHNALKSENGQPVISKAVAITGLGGIGKTELAREYINKHSLDYNNIIWIDAETKESLKKSFQELVKELKISIREVGKLQKLLIDRNGGLQNSQVQEIDDFRGVGQQVQQNYKKLQVSSHQELIFRNYAEGKKQERDIKSIVKDIYKYFKDSKSLFVFDNAEEYKNISEFLPSSLPPGTKKPHILITSRNQEWDAEEEGKIEVVKVDQFTPDEAKKFIERSLEIKDNLQQTEVEQLAERLQYFPLALRQVVAYIQDKNKKSKRRDGGVFKISDYLREIEKQKERLLQEGGYKNSDRYTQTVLTTWTVTLKKIESDKEYGREAIDILNTMAYLDSNEVNVKALFIKLAADEEKVWCAVERLAKYSMINLEKGIASIHRLVQEVMRLKLKEQGKEAGILKKALEGVLKRYEKTNILKQV